jgi:hypothetical protein
MQFGAKKSEKIDTSGEEGSGYFDLEVSETYISLSLTLSCD